MNIITRTRNQDEEIPWELLLLADPSREKILEYIKDGVLWLAFLGNELVGEYVLLPVIDNKMEIKNIAVTENYQGKGIGRLLLLDAIKKAKELSARSVKICTGNSSIKQPRLYQSIGFIISEINEGFFTREYSEPIFENGTQCCDKVCLSMSL